MNGQMQQELIELFGQNQGQIITPRRRNDPSYYISSHYPYLGPRFLNYVGSEEDRSRVGVNHMRRYYSFIKGYDVQLLDINRPLFDYELDYVLDFNYQEMDVVYYDYDYYFDFYSQIGWIEHRPKSQWCTTRYFDDLGVVYFIRNEIDCVGYIGTTQYLNNRQLDFYRPRNLSDRCIEKLNILPSLFVPNDYSMPNMGCMRYNHGSKHNYICFNTEDGEPVFVELTDYDCYNLASFSPFYEDLGTMIGKQGCIYFSWVTIPDIKKLDGYRFWTWMYSDHNYWSLDIDSYFAGSAVRNERRQREDVDVDLSGLSRMFDQEEEPFGSNIEFQGIFDAFKVITDNEKREDILKSASELGKLASTVNSMKESYDALANQEWYKTILNYLMTFVGHFNDLANDFIKFSHNPKDYMIYIYEHARIGIQCPSMTMLDATKRALLVFASYHLYKRTRIIAIGLFNYAIQSLLSECMHTDIARNCATIITLTYIGLMEAMQLRPAEIEIQGTSDNLTSMVYSCVTFVTLSLGLKGITQSPVSLFNHLHSTTKNVFNIAKGTLALTKCVEFILSSFKTAIEFCFGDTFAYKMLVKATITSEDLQKYIVYALSTHPEDLAAKLTLDDDAKKEWSNMCKLHDDFILAFAGNEPPVTNHIGYSMYSKASSAFIKLKEEFDKIKDALTFFRVEPFMVWVWGKPGTGKTWCRDEFVRNMYSWHRSLDPTLDAKINGLLYVRNPADKYMSQYTGQFAVAYDDVGQNRQQDNPEFNEIMGIGSTNQVRLNMADLQDKGRMFSSKVVIMAANTQDVAANDLVLSEEAFNRRRHIVVKIERPDAKNVSALSTSKCDFTLVRIILTEPQNGGVVKTFPENGYGDNDSTFREFFKWLAPKYWEHVTTQSKALENKEKELKKLLDGDPRANVIRIDPKTGKVIEDDELIPEVDEIPEDEFYDTVDSEVFITKERQIIYEKIRIVRAVNQRFDEVCSLMSITDKPSEPLLQEFDYLCKKYLDRVLTSEEFTRMFKTNEFKLDPEIVLSLNNYWKEVQDKTQSKFPWLKFLGYVATGSALAGSVAMLYRWFSGSDDSFEHQSYSLVTRAPPRQSIVIQRSTEPFDVESYQKAYLEKCKGVLNNFIAYNKIVTTQKLSDEEQLRIMLDLEIIKPTDFAKYMGMIKDKDSFSKVNSKLDVEFQKFTERVNNPKALNLQNRLISRVSEMYNNIVHYVKGCSNSDLSDEDKIRALLDLKLIKPETLAKGFTVAIDERTFDEAVAEIELEIQKYSQIVKSPQSTRIEIQKSSEIWENSIRITDKISNSFANFIRIGFDGQTTKDRICGFNIGYKVWILPRHFFDAEIEDTPVRIEMDSKPYAVVTIPKECIHEYHVQDLDGKVRTRDLVFVEINQLNAGPDLTRHFAKMDHILNTKNFNAKLLHWNIIRERSEEIIVGTALRWDKPMEHVVNGSAVYYSDGYRYPYQTMKGDCGALLLSTDRTTMSTIYGIHFGYEHTSRLGLSFTLPREDVLYILDQINPIGRIVAQSPKIEFQGLQEVPADLMASDGYPHFEILGLVPDAPLPPLKHKDLFRSPMYDDVYPAEKDLSVLHKFDERMDKEFQGDPDILTRGVTDFDHKSIPWPEPELSIATEALINEFENFSNVVERRVHTIDEAINGIWVDGKRIEHSEPLNLKTSSGYGLNGIKKEHFEVTDLYDDYGKLYKHEATISNPILKQMVDDQWNDWMQGKTHPCIWSHTLKSEPLKLSKIKNGNTRTFCVAQTAYLINVRRLFGAFTISMKSSKIKSFSCLGVDATSPDWNSLYLNLRDTGAYGVDLDFFKYDRTAVTWQLAYQVVQAINAWYNDSVELQRARIIAFEDMIFSYALIGKIFTRKRRGNPSGNPLTTELNNCVNYLMLCMVYLLVAKLHKPSEYGIKQWKRNVNMKAYGDDLIFTVSPDCQQWFDLKTLTLAYTNYGVPVTPADKSDSGLVYKPLRDLTFLKRSFIPFNHPSNKWVGALDKTSIRNMVQFYRLKPGNGTVDEALRTNCEESLKEAYFWGKEFFLQHRQKLNDWFRTNSQPPIDMSFEELDFVFRDKIEQF